MWISVSKTVLATVLSVLVTASMAYGVSKAAIRKIFAINTAKHLDIEPTVSLDDLK